MIFPGKILHGDSRSMIRPRDDDLAMVQFVGSFASQPTTPVVPQQLLRCLGVCCGKRDGRKGLLLDVRVIVVVDNRSSGGVGVGGRCRGTATLGLQKSLQILHRLFGRPRLGWILRNIR